MMVCTNCDNNVDMRKTKMTYITKYADIQYEIHNTPIWLCPDCNEVFFEDAVLDQIDILIANAKDSVKEDVCVIEYTTRM